MGAPGQRERRTWTILAAMAAGVLLLAPRPAAALRVVATDLCADQAAVALLPRDEIAGLSRWARDPAISPVRDEAEGLPVMPASAEAVLMSDADIVLMDVHADRATARLLERLGVRLVRVPAANDFPGMIAILRTTARALGREPAGDALAADLQARLDRLPPVPRRRPEAVYLRPDGGSAGAGTAVDAALDAAGFRNLVADRGHTGWGGLTLESLVMAPPDVLVTSFFDGPVWMGGNGFSRHPAFRRIAARTPRIAVPAGLWACGGWPLVEAAERLAAGRVRLERPGP